MSHFKLHAIMHHKHQIQTLPHFKPTFSIHAQREKPTSFTPFETFVNTSTFVGLHELQIQNHCHKVRTPHQILTGHYIRHNYCSVLIKHKCKITCPINLCTLSRIVTYFCVTKSGTAFLAEIWQAISFKAALGSGWQTVTPYLSIKESSCSRHPEEQKM
jgi:hypothetical protein